MEHSWGRNISEQGLSGLLATMAARLPPFPSQDWLTNAPLAPSGALYAHVPLDTAFPITFARIFVFAGHPHFPYGHAVEPDVPL